MKKLFSLFVAAILTTAAWAVPAKPGLWQTLTLKDGTQVRAELKGDEYGHFWETASGKLFVRSGNTYAETTHAAVSEMLIKERKRRNNGFTNLLDNNAGLKLAATTSTAPGDGGSHLVGNKRCLVILAEFQDKEFADGHDQEFFNRYCNEEGFSEDNFMGSTRDYFKAQSNGQLIIDFDVVGPIKLSGNSIDYAGSGGTDNVQAFAKECIEGVADQVDFSKYDWGNDGYVDEVFIIYAGHGRADSSDETSIWPHKYNLSSALTYNGKKLWVYACSSELNGSGDADGIGTMCHEFSHCMGFPDMYDIDYRCGYNGMGTWDLMCSGSYNGDGYCPPNYSGYEKWCTRWQYPIVLDDEDVEVTNMKSLSDNGDFYVIYNQKQKNELYYIENRQRKGWDLGLSGKGLLVVHLDYNATVWRSNSPNCNSRGNDHQRIEPICADGKNDSYSTSGDTYPLNKLDSLTNNSKPKAFTYNANSDGKYTMNKALQKIKQNSDGTISFNFQAVNKTIVPVDVDGEVLFAETFNECEGTGGNDGKFSGSVANGDFLTDEDGWDNGTNNKTTDCSGGDKCGYFKNVSPRTPTFRVDGTATIIFKAAPFSFDATTLTVTSTNSDVVLSETEFTMTRGQWTDYSLTITGSGSTRLQFSNGKRFFLDDLCVYIPNTTGIELLEGDFLRADAKETRIYNISGQYVGNSPALLQKGIYIMNGKKFVVK